MVSTGRVRDFSQAEGVGVIDSQDTPAGCWVHFSAVAVEGYKSLAAGQAVEFDWEAFRQDGYDFRAVRVWPAGETPYDEPLPRHGASAAYHSSLTVRWGGDADPEGDR
jgi:CspA family cold shock protein